MLEHIQTVRQLLADYPELNYATKNVFFSDENILNALHDALTMFNQHPPFETQYQPNDMPFKYVWYIGAIVLLYRTLLAEEITLPEYGSSIPLANRSQLYSELLNLYEERFETLAASIKHQLNLAAAFGTDPRATYPPVPWW